MREIKEIRETIPLMTSGDYKERFVAEYYQLKIRKERLCKLLEAFNSDCLGFELNCPVELLQEQYMLMCQLINILENRARYENIEL